MKSFEPPKFLANVYRDLRDRHLLIPALGLLAAIVAVPFLLGKSSGPDTSPPPAAVSTEASATQPAVLAAEQVNVRDYRKRLDELKSKNPFHQQFVVPTETDTTGTGGTTTGTGSTAGTTSAVPSSGPGATQIPTATGGSATSTSSSPSDSGSPANPKPGDVEVVHELFTRRVDVMVGVQGDLKRRNNVKPMTILPNLATPVVAFLGTDEPGKRAAFVVSSDATPVDGDGACVPTPANCLYITLQKGESVTLDYGPDGQTYELKLLTIRDVKL